MHTEILKQLEHAARTEADCRIADCLARESGRVEAMTLSAAGLCADLSKQRLSLDTWRLLAACAEAAGVADAISELVGGAEVNRTERRAALHTALRGAPGTPADKLAAVAEVRAPLAAFVDAVRSGARTGYSGKRFTDVVNIGIGGSHLGPQLACDALRYAPGEHLRAHFLANVDGGEFDRIVGPLDPDTTLFIVASKSFSTVETRLNATSARRWLAARHADPAAVASHFVAVSANPARAVEFGIDADNVFPMWDWVGGRYSMWSAIGLPIALSLGLDTFDGLLAGAGAMDAHFASASPAENLPVMLAMVGIWNSNVLGAPSYAVVPYDDRLRFLPDYLQQLEMESNGKRVGLDGEYLSRDSAPITWGGLGTNAQHAFFQLLHQGTRLVPVDFVLALTHPAARPEHHDMLVANCLAQAEGLMSGSEGGDDPALARHRETPGNRPSTVITMAALEPATLGALIALYEHKTYVQSVIWGINAFDQWGVELGKQLATAILEEVAGGPPAAHDPSTTALIAAYRRVRED
ncbi:MAG: glucose-6-phosphate isomerase [Gammaproteobacteria bacterium]